ncbi:hypothetical protein MCUN1_001585 [Malassezia cuniculi]|uniref:SCP2 domain-containing protein n=1 Tax=Malassezia cuniculi TaxID=948313 RepID=A0AAF0JAX5_9BASI|nr:hypothetical protein MCUN1_001585 [Malassezia cuniculi]
MSSSLEPIANHALSVYPELNQPGFESSKVFALTALYLARPPASFSARRVRQAELAKEYVFNINPSGKNTATMPATWHITVGPKIKIARGRPRTPIFWSKTRRVTIECSDRDLVDLATGKIRSQELYQNGRIKVTGSREKAIEISKLLSHERHKLYRVVDNSNKPIVGTNPYDEGLQNLSANPDFRSKL